MATAEHTDPQGQTEYRESRKPITELDRLLQKKAKIDKALDSRVENITDLLPDFVKDQATRFVARAKQYWARSPDLQQCTEASFVKCVIEAAELGFAIDGKMVHAVKFNTRVKGQKDQWEAVAQVILDYKALIAVAKRHGLVQDVWARIVMPSDTFIFEEINGKVSYGLTPNLDAARDKAENARGVLAVATNAAGWFRAEWMPIADVLAIKARSKSGDKGPWVTDQGEMCKKTAIKRILKTFSDDPGLLRALETDDQYEALEADEVAPHERGSRIDKILKSPVDSSRDLPLTPEEEAIPFDPPDGDSSLPIPQDETQSTDTSEAAEKPLTDRQKKYRAEKARTEAAGEGQEEDKPQQPDVTDEEILDGWKFRMEAVETLAEVIKIRKEELPQVPERLKTRVRNIIVSKQNELDVP